MLKLKIIIKILLMLSLIASLFFLPSFSIQIKTLVFFSLFLVIALIDGLSFNYLSFLISALGTLLFNPIYSLDFSSTSMYYIQLWLIGIINVWVLVDVWMLFKESNKNSAMPERTVLNENTRMYEVYDGSFKYEISPDLIVDLQGYMHTCKIGLVDDWYRRLNNEKRKKVAKILNSK